MPHLSRLTSLALAIALLGGAPVLHADQAPISPPPAADQNAAPLPLDEPVSYTHLTLPTIYSV